jgi:ATP-dependent DNA helicase RecQ
MTSIAFIDAEIDPNSGRILDLGGMLLNGDTFHAHSIQNFIHFLNGIEIVCGHNIIHHDLKYLQNSLNYMMAIDTLFLSPLLFPAKPYHALLKDDKLQTEELNNPLNDAKKAKDLFFDELAAFEQLNFKLKQIFYSLLHDKDEFKTFFYFAGYSEYVEDLETLIFQTFHTEICEYTGLQKIIAEHPIELAYCLALIHTQNRYSITPPWVLKNFPEVERIMYLLRNNPCLFGCSYCNQALDAHLGLKKFFGFDEYRTFGGEALQEQAVEAAIHHKSLLAVFPTGGGKSITFQVPALMSGENSKGLSIVISPLQSLMKDQVDNLEKAGITEAVTINGLLDPIERAKSFERVENGSASILYISPESLRSKTMERLILGRNIVRFVVDEAHCFSSWGQDFRVDYLYIGDFIKNIQQKKNMEESIPVSCFTATAKQNVIEDIRNYFKEKLGLYLQVFSTNTARKNIQFRVIPKDNEEEKYHSTRSLIEAKNCPTIIYVSRTRKAYLLAKRLTDDGFMAKPYHGKMDKQEKSENQDAFIRGEVQIMVATSAFGMGVDKKDVGMVIHYEISDSLENYIQEAGRAGRDERITADCFVLYNEDDLSKHFILLNQTKLSIKEIQQVWRAIKELTRFRSKASNSALEIARKAGWDDNIGEIETRVTTAIAALEESGYIKRGQNMPRIYANSILSKNAQEAIDKINASEKFRENQKQQAVRIIKKLFSSKSRKQANEEAAETRIDYISDHLGIVKEEVINVINLLREEKILADTKDLTAFIKRGEKKNRSLSIVQSFSKIEDFLLSVFQEQETSFHIKELNEEAEDFGCRDVSPHKIKTLINFWAIKNWIKRNFHDYASHHIDILLSYDKESLKEKLEERHELASFIIDFLYERYHRDGVTEEEGKEQVLVEFSVHELKTAYENRNTLFKKEVSISQIEDSLFYLSRIEALKIEGGFLVVYNRLTIERLEQDNKKRYKAEDYQKLNQFYENKVQQIHIVGEYAKRMIQDYQEALQFVDDYFQLNYASFLNKYFKGSRQNEIKRNITPAKFRQLFGDLSPAQLSIIKDNKSRNIAVLAGPGSGKTRVLVHKLASLLLMEDVKHEQLLMVTFSRASASEFKKRLLQLIGNAANFIEIKTFHSYCFDLMGRVGDLEKSGEIIRQTIDRINHKDIETNRISKAVLVIDEAQDMDADEYALISTLMSWNEEMRVIAVGDDDQNIYEFRGSDSKYLEQFIHENQAKKYELLENYRSKNNLVEFSNQFVKKIQLRLKQHDIFANQSRQNGKIIINKYHSEQLIEPLVNNVLAAGLSGTTCVLTRTNEEAAQITGLLLKKGIHAMLIQSNEGFSLYNLYEIRFFLNQLKLKDDVFTINDDLWVSAKKSLWNTFKNSSHIDICIHIIKDFEANNPKTKYKSDLEVFIRESKLEDFFHENGEIVYVSTIHKVKGKEFDQVFLMLSNIHNLNDKMKHQIYVAISRAKNKLSIHTNCPCFDDIIVDDLQVTHHTKEFSSPKELIIKLSLKDIWLDYSANKQYHIGNLMSGDTLKANASECFTTSGHSVLKFSKSFMEKTKALNERGFKIKDAIVNFIVYWQKEDTDTEVKIVLPELYFVRTAKNNTCTNQRSTLEY